jgi:hypothetical protein
MLWETRLLYRLTTAMASVRLRSFNV